MSASYKYIMLLCNIEKMKMNGHDINIVKFIIFKIYKTLFQIKINLVYVLHLTIVTLYKPWINHKSQKAYFQWGPYALNYYRLDNKNKKIQAKTLKYHRYIFIILHYYWQIKCVWPLNIIKLTLRHQINSYITIKNYFESPWLRYLSLYLEVPRAHVTKLYEQLWMIRSGWEHKNFLVFNFFQNRNFLGSWYFPIFLFRQDFDYSFHVSIILHVVKDLLWGFLLDRHTHFKVRCSVTSFAM